MFFNQLIARVFFPYRALDPQIEKFKKLAKEYEAHNRAYYGEYLSGILFD